MLWHKAWRFGIRYGKFVLMYERIVNKPKPIKNKLVSDEKHKPRQLKKGGVDIYV